MTKPADVTAAPIHYFGIDLYPLKIADWGELDRWMQQDIMDQAIETARRNSLTGEILTATMVGAQKIAQRTSTSTLEGMAKLNSFEGFLKIIELASGGKFTDAQRNELTEQDMATLVEEVGSKILEISQPEAVAGANTEGPKKK